MHILFHRELVSSCESKLLASLVTSTVLCHNHEAECVLKLERRWCEVVENNYVLCLSCMCCLSSEACQALVLQRWFSMLFDFPRQPLFYVDLVCGVCSMLYIMTPVSLALGLASGRSGLSLPVGQAGR